MQRFDPYMLQSHCVQHLCNTISDMLRPVETLTEQAMLRKVLPTFTKGCRVEWYAMARERNLRVFESHKLHKPLDASLKHENVLKAFAEACTTSVGTRVLSIICLPTGAATSQQGM